MLVALSATALMTTALILTIDEMAYQIDTFHKLVWNASFVSPLLLLFFSGLLFFMTVSLANWFRAAGLHVQSEPASRRTVSPIETALSALILDFVQEREDRRKSNKVSRNATINVTDEVSSQPGVPPLPIS